MTTDDHAKKIARRTAELQHAAVEFSAVAPKDWNFAGLTARLVDAALALANSVRNARRKERP